MGAAADRLVRPLRELPTPAFLRLHPPVLALPLSDKHTAGELTETAVSDLLLLLEGKLSYQLAAGRWGELRAGQTLPLPLAGGKNERTQLRVETPSLYLRC